MNLSGENQSLGEPPLASMTSQRSVYKHILHCSSSAVIPNEAGRSLLQVCVCAGGWGRFPSGVFPSTFFIWR